MGLGQITLGFALPIAILLGALIHGGCAEGVTGGECIEAATSDLYDYAQLVLFMALGAGTKQLLFSSRITSRLGEANQCTLDDDDNMDSAE